MYVPQEKIRISCLRCSSPRPSPVSHRRGSFESDAMTRLIHQKKVPRSFLRRSANNLVRVSCGKKGAKEVALDLAKATLDLSEAGARLLVSAPLEVGEEIVLGLEGPWHKDRLLRIGFVVWSFQVGNVGY